MNKIHYKGKIHLTTGLNIHYATIQGLYWIASASMYAFIVVFLTGRGFSTAQIGYINAFRTGSAIFAQLFFGHLGDKYKHIPLKYMIGIAIAISIGANTLMEFSTPDVFGMTTLFLVLGVTECSIVALMDSMAMQFINRGVPMNYSGCRAAGSVSYAFTCVILGTAIDSFGSEVVVLVHGITLALLLLATLTFMTFRDLDGHQDRRRYIVMPKGRGSMRTLLTNFPQYRYLLIANAAICFGYWPCSNFMATLIEHTGGSNSMLGIALFLTAFTEMPMLIFLFPRLSKKFSMDKLLLFSGAMHLLRWTLVGFAPQAWILVALSAMQMVSFAISLPASIYYINQTIPEENRIKGQTLYNIAGSVGGTIGNALSGMLIELCGVQNMVHLNCLVIAFGVVMMIIMVRKPAVHTA